MRQQKRRLLVTGASGVLGWTMCRTAKDLWDTFGTCYQNPVSIPGVCMSNINIGVYSALRNLFDEIKPDAVVHAAALSNPDYCQLHPGESETVNVLASANIASLCADRVIPFVFTSSDLVFDGENAPYSEKSPPAPISVYGEHKVRAETEIRARYPDAVVCRLPLMFGTGSPVAIGALGKMIQAIKNGEEVALFVDEVRTPVSTQVVADGMMLVLEKVLGTTVHFGGPERLSRWELGQLIAEVFGLNRARLVKRRQADVLRVAPRPRDVSLASDKAELIGYRPPRLREQLQTLLQDPGLMQ